MTERVTARRAGGAAWLTAALAALILAGGAPAGAAGGGAGDGAGDDGPATAAAVDLLTGWETDEGTRMAAIRVRLAPGWKTYWRAPGEGGLAARFDWSGSRNLARAVLHWPTPQVIRSAGVTTIGYTDELVLPVEFAPEAPGPILLRARLDLGVCRDVCMPLTVRLSADLAGAAGPDSRILEALARQPTPAEAAGVREVSCTLEPIADGLRVTARMTYPSPVPSPAPSSLAAGELAVFELPRPDVWISGAVTRREGDVVTAIADLVPADARPFPLDPAQLRITLFGAPGQAVDIRGCPPGE